MLARLVLATVLLLAGKDPHVVGTWGVGGETLLRINGDGTGEAEGESFTWSTDKGVLTTVTDGETEKVGYSVKGGRLVIAMDGEMITLEKIGGPAPAKGKTGKAVPVPEGMEGLSPEEVAMLQQMMAAQGGQPAAGNAAKAPKAAKAGTDELSQFLMRNAWCTFTFNKTSGASSKSRAVFFPDGTFSGNAQSEGYSSGYGGTMASQHDSGDSGEWKVMNGKLHLRNAETGNQWVLQELQITRNSNGSPIINAGGKEYMVCE